MDEEQNWRQWDQALCRAVAVEGAGQEGAVQMGVFPDVLSNTVSTSHTWPLHTFNVAGVTEEPNSSFASI